MRHLKPNFIFQNLLLFLLLFSIQNVNGSKSHLDHPKYKHASKDVIKNKHIIKFSKSYTDETATFGTTFLNSINQQFPTDVHIKVLYHYTSSIFHGLSIRVDAPNDEIYSTVLNAMMDHPDIESVHSQFEMKHAAAGVNFGTSGINLAVEPTDLINPHHMTQVKRVHDELKNKGKGIFIGVIDSGIDYNHPALGGGFGKGHKVATGYDLVGDHFDPRESEPVEDADPFDSCPTFKSGHGTHVAGIIAGYDPSKNFSGVAPEATLGMWRVFSCSDFGTQDATLLEALIRAYEAGVDVINISIGGSTSWGVSAANHAIDNIVANGVIVVIAGGNSGYDPMYTSGDYSKSENAISVSSVENDYFYGANFKASGIDDAIPYTLMYGNTDHFPAHSVSLTAPSYRHLYENTTKLCSKKNLVFSSNDSIKDSLVLVSRVSDCFDEIIRVAREEEALGVIVISERNAFSGSVSPLETNITTFLILLDYGIVLQERLDSIGTVRIKLGDPESKSFLNRNLVAGTLSSFTSVGPTAELYFKPEISGVGGAILSTVPIKAGGWEISQGTSMAAPYVAGSIGLYLAAHGKKAKENPKLIKEKFMNYAKPVPVYKSHSLDSPLRQGAGLIQVYDAIIQTTQISPAKISFNDTATDLYKSHILTISNWGTEEVTYYLHNNISVGLMAFNASSNMSYYESAILETGSASVTFSSNTITIPAQQSTDVTVTVDVSDAASHPHLYYGGFISFESQNGADLSVPYFGVFGHQRDLPIFSPTLPPFLNDAATNIAYTSAEDGEILQYDSSGNNTIEINVNIVTPTSILKCELMDDKGEVLGYIPINHKFLRDGTVNQYNVDRNEDASYSAYNVDAYYIPTDVLVNNVALAYIQYKGVGRYRLSALKLFGNPDVIDDWETWTSISVHFV